jgi:uncharacterized protein
VTRARIRVRVVPGARTSAVVGRHGDGWKVRVAAVPERGRANRALLELLAERLGVRAGALRLVAGHTGRDKIVEVEGIGADELEGLLSRGGEER